MKVAGKQKMYRYPGVRTFQEEEQNLFFGREKDIEKLCRFIVLEPLVVLYGKSGLGKSSLLNAGVVPKLLTGNINDENYLWQQNGVELHTGFFKISFITSKEKAISPVDSVLQELKPVSNKNTFLDKLNPENNSSFWLSLKAAQINSNDKSGFFLLFDQFEEIFEFSEKQVTEFKRQLAELLSPNLPDKIRNALKELGMNEKILSKEEINLLYKKIPVKVVLAIRSDLLNMINRFRDLLPNILQKSYELFPLNPEQAEEAILNPASVKDESLNTPIFIYDKDVVPAILSYLSNASNDDDMFYESGIDSVSLQVICSHIEMNVVSKKNDLEINRSDLPENLGDIIVDYYRNQLTKLQLNHVIRTEGELRNVQVFIEEELIDNGHRIKLYGDTIPKKFNITSQMIHQLVECRLLEPERMTGGLYFQISHDSLVKPILVARDERIRNEKMLSATPNEAFQQSDQLKQNQPAAGGSKEVSDDSLIEIANSFEKVGDYQAAVEQYTNAISIRPDRALTYRNRGVAYQNWKKIDEAISDFRKAIELDAFYADAYNDLGIIFLDRKEFEEAIRFFNKAIESNYRYVYAYNNLGVTYNTMNNPEEALKAYSGAIEVDPSYATAFKNRGLLYYNLGKYHQAIDDLEKFITMKTDDDEAYNELGRSYHQLKDYQNAVQNFDRVVKLVPEQPYGYFNLGTTYNQLKNTERALLNYSLAIEKDSRYENAYYNRALIYRKEKRYDEAVADLKTAVQINPSEDNYATMVKTMYSAGKIDDVEMMLPGIVSLFPKSELVLSRIIEGQTEAKQFERALMNSEKLIQMNPENVSSLIERSSIFFYMKDYATAEIELKKILVSHPDNPVAIGNLGAIILRQNRYEEALSYVNRAIAMDEKDYFALTTRAYIYLKMGELDKAESDLQQALICNDEYSYAVVYNGYLNMLHGNEEYFFDSLEKAIAVEDPYPLDEEIESDILLSKFKDDPRMIALVEKSKQRHRRTLK